MPPRYAYWTILVDEQPTAFRASSQEDLMPTFKRLKEKNASAKMMWWQNGKLWASRLDAQEAMRARGEMGRARDVRQRQVPGERKPFRRDDAGETRPRRESSGGFKEERRDPSGKLEWRPKGSGAARPSRPQDARSPRPQDGRFSRPQDGRSSRPQDARSSRPQDYRSSRPQAPRTSRPRDLDPAQPPRTGKLEWKPKGEGAPPKRKWVPKEEYKKAQGIEARRDKNWRPGGEHRDPRQKYKDAKKAKWTRFKQNIRQKWESKQGGRKKRDDK